MKNRFLSGLSAVLVTVSAVSNCGGGSSERADGSGGTGGEGDGDTVEITTLWDLHGIVGTGQSLSVGTTPITSSEQPYQNLKLDLGGATIPPWDASQSELALVPLVEPIRPLSTTWPSPYPGNIGGETPHSAMANQITWLTKKAAGQDADYVSVHSVVGESGQGMVALNKQASDTTGETGRAYAATLFEAEAITRIAAAEQKSYGIAAIVMTHGETDSGSSTYKEELIQLHADYNTDLAAITGQEQAIPMFLTQQFAYPSSAGTTSVATQAQWELGVERPGDFVCVGPKYQYPGHGDGVHLSSEGYRQLGEKLGQVYFERLVLGRDWRPLEPISVSRDGRNVIVKFHVPVPPLTWDNTLPSPTNWGEAQGFELRRLNSRVGIASVALNDDTVVLTAAADLPAEDLFVSYAMTAESVPLSVASQAVRWGCLRDSDPFVGSSTGVAQPNYAVAFTMPVP